MDILVLDKNLNSIAVIDTFESLIWTDRYSSCGDFEIYAPVSQAMINVLMRDNYLWLKESEHLMVIEKIEVKTDIENGNKLVVTGRSIESLLNRRVIFKQTILDGGFQNGIKVLLDNNCIVCSGEPLRVMSKVIFEESADPLILAMTVSSQFLGENLYDVIKGLCDSNGLGFKMTLNNDNKFVFKLYLGTDRSYNQIANPYVVFSPKFDNIVNSHYLESSMGMKTFSLVGGEGQGFDRILYPVDPVGFSDIDRREMFTDGGGLSTNVNGGVLDQSDYSLQLEQKGYEDLSKNGFLKAFDGVAEPKQLYILGTDFFIGDIVQIENEYGMTATSQITEIIFSQNSSGTNIYPTFISIS